MLENKFQSELIKKIKKMFPGCIVLKNDSSHVQGIPDLSIFFKKHWAMLEVKKSASAHHQPNQDFFIKKAKEMSFGAFIYPENEEVVLNELQRSFKS